MKKILFSIFVAIFSGLSPIVAQPIVAKTVAPSPQAYAFAQYAEMPVSLFTGTPSINIPLYTITCGQYSMPISLSYHASGIKVAQEASWVGLGWNLNAGGAVSRSIRGWDDLLNGYFEHNKIIPPKWDENNWDSDIASSGISGYTPGPITLKVDTEPDVFYYNFLGYSGKFYCKNGGLFAPYGKGFYMANPDDNIKIEYYYLTFTLTTPDGTVALFKASEMTKPYSISFDKFVSQDEVIIPEVYPADSPVTSWDLRKITFPNKEVIEFIYDEVRDPFLPIMNITHSFHNHMVTLNNYGTTTSQKNILKTLCQANVINRQSYLKEIRWKSGSLKFETSKREDFRMKYTTDVGCPKLDKVSIYRPNETVPFRQFVFHESYFTNSENSKNHADLRLKLDSVSICANAIRNVYKFNYDTRYPLPSKYSNSQDYWGYYNGRKNSTLYPRIEVSKDYTIYFYNPIINLNDSVLSYRKGAILNGANREAAPEYITTGMLTSIESPEGAVTTYTYEANEARTERINGNVYAGKETYTKLYNVEMKEYTIHLTEKRYVELYFLYNGNVADPQEDRYKHELVSLKSVNGTVSKTFGINDFADIKKYDYTIRKMIECPPGDYKFTLRSSNYLSQQAELRFYDPFENKYGGGVRIAKISSPLSTREYIYKDDSNTASSGIFMRKPFNEALQFIEWSYFENSTVFRSQSFYLTQQSSPVFPLESPQANTPIGYQKVKVITRSSARTTEEEFYYAAAQERVDANFPGMPGEYIYMNGKLLKHLIYANGKLQQKDENSYEELVVDSLNALFQETLAYRLLVSYKVPIVHCRVKNSTSEIYDPQTSAVNRSVTAYNYNTMNYLPSVVTVENGSNKRVTETTYSVDLKNNSTSYNEMCGYQQITAPVEVRTYENGILSRKELHEYKKHAIHPIYVPSKDYRYFHGSTYSPANFDGSNGWRYGPPDVTYTEYDESNNCMEMKTRTGQSTVYLWGYNRLYPIAQIFNATLDEVKAAGITDSKNFATGIAPTTAQWAQLHALRSRMPKASVSVFQYDPLVGVTTVTNPRGMNTYYEYDAMGRLVVERDNERNIIRTYHYTLKNER